MALPRSKEARLFYRCALQRHEDAQILARAERTTGAVYLAGYAVECMLKALIISGLDQPAQRTMLESFRGARAHDYEWLRTQYLQNRGPRFPREITEAFTLVNEWSTDMRYAPGMWKADDAESFLSAAEKIIEFAKGRL